MATKLLRKTFYQFGLTVNGASEIGQFGSYTSPDYSGDVEIMQSGTCWPRGWFPSTQNTNKPFIQDMNAVDFVFSYMIATILQMGISEYDANTYYFLNSIVQIAGQIYISLQDNNQGNPPQSSPSSWQAGLPGSEISGVIKPYAGTVAPSGYLLCQGQAVSRTTYAALFAVCGTAFGIGDGLTTFNIPNLQGRVPVGYLSSDPNFGIMGQIGGEVAHTLTVPEMPSHNHPVYGYGGGSSGFGINLPSDGDGPLDLTVATGNSGGGQPHNNLQPFLTLNYIIKT